MKLRTTKLRTTKLGWRIGLNREQPAEGMPRLRLDYLEGLRGCTALYVVFFHLWYIVRNFAQPHPKFFPLLDVFALGRPAVAIFIVLSGYVLMLPVLQTAEGRLRGGWKDYLKRRARRILPPYYAAVLISLAALVFVPDHSAKPVLWLDYSRPAFTPKVLLSHLFLLHNLSSHWIYAIDLPLWSVATEWQIYFFFPLLLLPLFRRFGIAAAVTGGFVVGLGIHFATTRFDLAAPWFLGLFALGMAGAVVSVSDGFPGRQDAAIRRLTLRFPWGMTAGFLALLVAAAHLWLLHWHRDMQPWELSPPSDILIGLTTVCFLIHCTKSQASFWGLRLLQSRAAVALGAFSYSLYLIHSTVLGLIQYGLNFLSLSPALFTAAFFALGLPLSVGAAYVFHLAFERPFMSSRSVKPANPQ